MSDTDAFSYADRYGIHRRPRWKLIALIIAAAGIGWTAWAGLHHANPEIRSTLISFTPVDQKSISIRYEVIRRTATREFICTLVARDIDKNIVGEIDDLIPAGESHVTRQVLIPTRVNPVNAAVQNCRAK